MTDSVPACRRAPRASKTGVVKDGWADAARDHGKCLAARYMVRSGIKIPDRTWGWDQCETDIVVTDDACLVVVELRTWLSRAFSSVREAVAAVKATRLRRLGYRPGAVPA